MEDKDNPAAQKIMNQPHPHSTDETPYYLSFRHPQNFFEIDYPAHWQLHTEEDGAVEFVASSTESFAGLMLFRTPVSVDADQIVRLGKWKELATVMFQQIQSTTLEQDPTIIYDNYRVERPETDPLGYRWFVLCFDLILGISSSYSSSSKHVYEPIIERMLSSLRIHRDEELLASQVLSRVTQSISDSFPDTDVKVNGMTLTVNQFQLSIGNLLSQVKRNPSGMKTMIEHFVQGIVGLSKQTGEKLGSESWEAVRGRIQPLLKTDKYIQEANQRTQLKGDESLDSSAVRFAPFLISAPWLAELRICFAIDNKDTFRFIHSQDLERWGISLELLLNTAVENLAAFPEPEVYTMRLSEDSPAIGSLQHHGGAASSYLLHPKLFTIASQQLGRSIVAAVPSRDTLMMFEYRDNRSMLQHAVERDYSTTNHPVSDRLFRITPDGVALL